MSYIDTSIIVAALDPGDPRQGRARRILETGRDSTASELVVAELASVISRREELVRSMADSLGLPRELVPTALILYILKRFKLSYRAVEGRAKTTLLGRMGEPIATAVELAPNLRLKTLDLLHAAYIKILKETGEPIHTLITADAEFEKASKQLEETLKVKLHVLKP